MALFGRLMQPFRKMFARAVYALDAFLRRRLNIFEYSDDLSCIFRASTHPFEGEPHTFADGETVKPGDPVAELHLWTEHVPLMEAGESPIAWARTMSDAIDGSLQRLAQRFSQPPFVNAIAIHAEMTQASTPGQSDQLARIMTHYGFEVTPIPPPRTLRGRLHRFGENILVSMLVRARTGPALRADTLRRVRQRAIMSRRTLLERYLTEAAAT
jgi:hypothetical protein